VARLVFAAVLLWAAAPSSAQTTVDGRAWWNVTFQERPGTERPWRWYFELQGRHRDGVTGFDQLLVRPAVGYDLPPRSSLWAGYGYTPGFPPTGDVLTENRMWQQYLWAGPGLGSALQWRSRLEQRWIEAAGSVAWRFRQFVRLTKPVSTRGGLAVVVWDEMFVHLNDTGRTAQGFDQNRVFGGIGVSAGRHARVEVGYLNQAIHAASGPNRRNHVLLAFVNTTS